tara:strand:+ start:3215 stop:5179 length:1965 start_codon:yes stop_codon:yes gene_type:complete
MDSGDIKLIELGSYVRPEVKEYYGKDWVLNGENNSYPQYVIDRRIGSPTNGAIIEVFCELMFGKGLSIGDTDEVYEALSEIFPKTEQRKCLSDFKTFGYYFMQILRGKGTEKKIAKILHLPVEKMGRDKMDEEGDINGAWYCEDWTSIHKNKPEFIPEFKGELTESRMVKSVVPHQQGQTYFSLPSYVQGLQYAEMEEEISNYCINHIKNGLSFGYIINFNNGGALTSGQKNDVETMIKEKLTGSNNAGKFILSFNDSKDVEVTVVPLEVSDAHSQWEFLTKLSSEKIVTSHGAFPALFGLQTSSGFSSNAEELDVQSKLVQDYQINPKQLFFIDELVDLLKINNLDTDLKFIPLRDNYNSTEEEEIEVPIVEGDPSVEQAPKVSKETARAQASLRGSVGGVQGILGIQKSYSEGLTDFESAVTILMEIYGFDRMVSENLLGRPDEDVEVDSVGFSNHICMSDDEGATLELANHLITFGEDLNDKDWYLLSSNDVDYDTDDLIYESINLATSTGVARPNSKSDQDSKDIVIRYRYVGNKLPQRTFCRKMMFANKLYRKEDIQQMDKSGVNDGFGLGGTNSYSIWLWKGGGKMSTAFPNGTCRHKWQREIYLKRGGGVDVNSPLAKMISTSGARRKGYKVPTNNSDVSITPHNNK